jgi:hypothetical protein
LIFYFLFFKAKVGGVRTPAPYKHPKTDDSATVQTSVETGKIYIN